MTITKDYDTQAQVEMFDNYCAATSEVEDRVQVNMALSYLECEWEAFQYGWNAAKQYFSVTGVAL
jgi:hypothetical protein